MSLIEGPRWFKQVKEGWPVNEPPSGEVPLLQDPYETARRLAEGKILAGRTSEERAAYGFFVNVRDPWVLAVFSRFLKKRSWGKKPVTGIIPEQVESLVDTQSLELIQVGNRNGLDFFYCCCRYNFHNIVPIGPEVPEHLITKHDGEKTISVMMFTPEEYGPLVEVYKYLLEIDPRAIIGGSSFNRPGESPCTTMGKVTELLQSGMGRLVSGRVFSHFPDEGDQALPGGAPMILFSQEGVSVYRGGQFWVKEKKFSIEKGSFPFDLLNELR